VADSEGDVRSALGESYVDGVRRHSCVISVGRSTQEEEEDEGLVANGGRAWVAGAECRCILGQLVRERAGVLP